MYNKQYYDSKRQDINAKYQAAQKKWLQLCELAGQEYIDFQSRMLELNEKLKALNVEEEASKKQEESAKKEVKK